jgi:hypothetical protein
MDELNGYHHFQPPHGQTILLLGRVLERSEGALVRLDRIDARLVTGELKMASLAARIERLEVAPPPSSEPKPEEGKSLGDRFDAGMTRVERVCKLAATYLGPALLALFTLPWQQLVKFGG